MRCGMINTVGTSMGNCRKAGRKAVAIGIASSRLYGCGFINVVMSFVAVMRTKNITKSIISMYMYVVIAAFEPAANQSEVIGKNNCIPCPVLVRVK